MSLKQSVTCGLASLLMLAGFACHRGDSPLLVTPVQALEFLQNLQVKSVYYNGAAHGALVQANPPWLNPAEREAKAESVRAMAQAAQNPKLFRQLDRQFHFDVLMLAGDPVQYKPLMDHLVKSGDWALEWADAFCLIYRRGNTETLTMERIRSVARSWEGLSVETRAELLSALSDHLVAARRGEAAREMLDMAAKLAPHSPSVWTSEGVYKLARGEWVPAVSAAEKALKYQPKFRPALSVKAQGLYFSKQFSEAYRLSSVLLKDAPDDPVMLFAHAKIAHEVRALQEEISVLNKLIRIAEREGRPTSWYRVYLGQAYAITGEGEGAIRELELALQDSELPAEQRDFASDSLKRVKSKVAETGPLK